MNIAGTGTLVYTLSQTTSVPEPSVTGGLLMLGLSAVASSLKKRHRE